MSQIFHYAFKVKDLESTQDFYHDLLGCEMGRSTAHWADFRFFGHQLSAHLSADIPELDYCGKVDGISVPIPHFGCLLDVDTFKLLAEKLKNAGVTFLVEPNLRYAGKAGEQWTMFFLDPSGNPIELKAFTNMIEVFSS